MAEVRCRNPDCRKVIALKLEGRLEFYCPRCHQHQIIVTKANLGKTEAEWIPTDMKIPHLEKMY